MSDVSVIMKWFWGGTSEQNNTLALERFSFLCGLGVKTTEINHRLTRVLISFFVNMTQTRLTWAVAELPPSGIWVHL